MNECPISRESIKLKSIIKNLRKRVLELNTRTLKINCPFRCHGDFDCVYIVSHSHENSVKCDNIEICPGNSDAFCADAVRDKLFTLRMGHRGKSRPNI